jgi:hypothetical protein
MLPTDQPYIKLVRPLGTLRYEILPLVRQCLRTYWSIKLNSDRDALNISFPYPGSTQDKFLLMQEIYAHIKQSVYSKK